MVVTTVIDGPNKIITDEKNPNEIRWTPKKICFNVVYKACNNNYPKLGYAFEQD